MVVVRPAFPVWGRWSSLQPAFLPSVSCPVPTASPLTRCASPLENPIKRHRKEGTAVTTRRKALKWIAKKKEKKAHLVGVVVEKIVLFFLSSSLPPSPPGLGHRRRRVSFGWHTHRPNRISKTANALHSYFAVASALHCTTPLSLPLSVLFSCCLHSASFSPRQLSWGWGWRREFFEFFFFFFGCCCPEGLWGVWRNRVCRGRWREDEGRGLEEGPGGHGEWKAMSMVMVMARWPLRDAMHPPDA